MKKLALFAALMLFFAQQISAVSPLNYNGSYYTTIFKEMTDADGVKTFIYKMLSISDVRKITDSGKTIQDVYPDFQQKFESITRSSADKALIGIFQGYGALFAGIGGIGFLLSAAQEYSKAKKASDYRRSGLKAIGGVALLAASRFLANCAAANL